jgi:hypothetical protein
MARPACSRDQLEQEFVAVNEFRGIPVKPSEMTGNRLTLASSTVAWGCSAAAISPASFSAQSSPFDHAGDT